MLSFPLKSCFFVNICTTMFLTLLGFNGNLEVSFTSWNSSYVSSPSNYLNGLQKQNFWLNTMFTNTYEPFQFQSAYKSNFFFTTNTMASILCLQDHSQHIFASRSKTVTSMMKLISSLISTGCRIFH